MISWTATTLPASATGAAWSSFGTTDSTWCAAREPDGDPLLQLPVGAVPPRREPIQLLQDILRAGRLAHRDYVDAPLTRRATDVHAAVERHHAEARMARANAEERRCRTPAHDVPALQEPDLGPDRRCNAAAPVQVLQEGAVCTGALRQQNEELAPLVEKTRGNSQAVPVLVETLDKPWGLVLVRKATEDVLGTISVDEGIVPSGTEFGITSRPARRSGRYILRSRSWIPTGQCFTRLGAPRIPAQHSRFSTSRVGPVLESAA